MVPHLRCACRPRFAVASSLRRSAWIGGLRVWLGLPCLKQTRCMGLARFASLGNLVRLYQNPWFGRLLKIVRSLCLRPSESLFARRVGRSGLCAFCSGRVGLAIWQGLCHEGHPCLIQYPSFNSLMMYSQQVQGAPFVVFLCRCARFVALKLCNHPSRNFQPFS